MNVYFDSRDPDAKHPAGAMQSGEVLTLRLLLDPNHPWHAVRTVIRYDRHETPAVYPMYRLEDTDGMAAYETRFVIEDRGLYWYHFEADTDGGTVRFGRNGENSSAVSAEHPVAWQQTVYRRDYDEPDWIYGGVYYHIFVDRFYHAGDRISMEGKKNHTDWGGLPLYLPDEHGEILNNDFFGGNLNGIREKLSYLSDLGVTCLYLSPVFEAWSNHKYDTGNYERIDRMFGSEEDFTALCREAGALGIRIILDGVFSHTGADSVYFNKYGHYGEGGAYRDPDSPYRKWYSFLEDGSYETWWGIRTLPRIRKEEPSYRAYINGEDGIVRKWLRLGASGWRLDVVDEFPSAFLEELVAAAKSEKEDALIIGEVWEDASNKTAYDERKNYFEGNKLDSVMDYPLKDAILRYLKSGDAGAIAGTVEAILENYPPFAVHALMNSLGTHDSIRAITALAGKEIPARFETREEQARTTLGEEERAEGIRLMKLASLLQMTLPGIPCIYYGDEAGLEGYADPFNRRCFPWGNENRELLGWYRAIIAIRRAQGVYRKGSYRTLAASGGLYAYERFDREGRYPSVITAMNAGEKEEMLIVEGSFRDLLTDRRVAGPIAILPGQMLILTQEA